MILVLILTQAYSTSEDNAIKRRWWSESQNTLLQESQLFTQKLPLKVAPRVFSAPSWWKVEICPTLFINNFHGWGWEKTKSLGVSFSSHFFAPLRGGLSAGDTFSPVFFRNPKCLFYEEDSLNIGATNVGQRFSSTTSTSNQLWLIDGTQGTAVHLVFKLELMYTLKLACMFGFS